MVSSSLRVVSCAVVALAIACGGGGTSNQPPNPDAPRVDGGVTDGPRLVDAFVPDSAPVSTCPASQIGTNDGCDCGCNVVDPDCPSPTMLSNCRWNNCMNDTQPDPADPSRCIPIPVPAGWTCSANSYANDNDCTCGCGAFDDMECTMPLTVAKCSSQHGCPSGQSPDPADLTKCIASPAGWTCSWKAYLDGAGQCTCGCGIADPGCPASARLADCDFDGCPSNQSPDPTALTTCMTNAPQDSWTCANSLLYDGSTCDCGCGAVDPDCGTSPTAATCDVVHCGANMELDPANVGKCREVCAPLGFPVGNATCTNGGEFSIGSACQADLYACTDGRRYEVECEQGQCVCRVNGRCVRRLSGSGCSLNSLCGWSLVDNT